MVKKYKSNTDYSDQTGTYMSRGDSSTGSGGNSEPALSLESSKLEAGLVGKLIGTKVNAGLNISLIVLVLIIILGASLLLTHHEFGIDYWKYTVSAITLIMGYIFGNRSS